MRPDAEAAHRRAPVSRRPGGKTERRGASGIAPQYLGGPELCFNAEAPRRYVQCHEPGHCASVPRRCPGAQALLPGCEVPI